MGEIAEMFLNGDCCQVCGEFMDGDGDGFPVTCAGCGGNDWEEDDWQSYREANAERSKTKKESNKQWSTSHLVEQGIEFETKNGIHLIVDSPEGKIDFWPSTGKFIPRNTKKHHRGVRELVRLIKQMEKVKC